MQHNIALIYVKHTVNGVILALPPLLLATIASGIIVDQLYCLEL
jgi:hypothetical protein